MSLVNLSVAAAGVSFQDAVAKTRTDVAAAEALLALSVRGPPHALRARALAALCPKCDAPRVASSGEDSQLPQHCRNRARAAARHWVGLCRRLDTSVGPALAGAGVRRPAAATARIWHAIAVPVAAGLFRAAMGGSGYAAHMEATGRSRLVPLSSVSLRVNRRVGGSMRLR